MFDMIIDSSTVPSRVSDSSKFITKQLTQILDN